MNSSMLCAATMDFPVPRRLAGRYDIVISTGRTFSFILNKLIHLGNCPVEGTDGETMIGHIHDEILAHDGQANEAEICNMSS